MLSYELEINVEPVLRRQRSNNRAPQKSVGRRPNLLDITRNSMTVDIESELSETRIDNKPDSNIHSDGGSIKQSFSLESIKKDARPDSMYR